MRFPRALTLRVAALLPAAGLVGSCASVDDPVPSLDLLIVGGSVIDGTGADPVSSDIGITGGKISFVGDAARARLAARRTIDARGLIVAPGFIDPHTHSAEDLSAPDASRRAALNHLMQGVTTVIFGNDGNGDMKQFEALSGMAGIGVNAASFVGFGPVRREVLGDSARAPDPAELARMKALVARGMCAGALGFSTGLYYAPQSFAKTPEVTALAAEAAMRGGIYDSHLRDEGSDNIGLEAAVDEALAIGRSAGLPVHIAHIKALGVDVHGKAPDIIRKVVAARAAGLRVTADQYPWTASGTRISSALVPRWAMEGGRAELTKRLADPTLQARLRSEMADNLRRRGGADTLLIIGGKRQGQRLDAVARAWKVDPLAAAVRILNEEGDAPIASFNMINADIEAFARQPWVVGSSDAVDGHPRKFGSFALRWQQFVRERKLLTPAAFVHRTSGLTASIFGISGRGTLSVGNFADVVVFDPLRFTAKATYDNPTALADGVQTVVVNGQVAVEAGKPNGALAGKPLRKARSSSWTCPA